MTGFLSLGLSLSWVLICAVSGLRQGASRQSLLDRAPAYDGARSSYISGMTTDAEELVRRYLALWQEYLTALLAEPATAALPQAWAGLWSGLLSERRDPAADE